MARSEDSGLSRRDFLAAGAAVAGMAAASQMNVFGEAPVSAPAAQKANFAMIPFGKTGKKVTIVGFGAIRISPPTGARVLKAAIDAGVNLVHTARGYGAAKGEKSGKSFASIAQLFEQEPSYRSKVLLCVKESDKVSEESLDSDLKILGVEYADAYLPQLQEPNQGKMEDAIAALDKLKKKGKIRFGGFTCHSKMNEVIELVVGKAPKGYDCCLISTAMLRPADSGDKASPEQSKLFAENLKKLNEAGVGIISMKSGASGVVSKGPEAYGAHMRVLAAAGVDTAITSFGSVQTVENAVNAGLSNLHLTDADIALWRQHWLADSWPCTMCGSCSGACPAGLPVADLMRMTMYRDHYHMAGHAKAEFAGLGLSEAAVVEACQGCSRCSGVCPVGLASAGKVREIVGSLA